jgi:hypothetical protein
MSRLIPKSKLLKLVIALCGILPLHGCGNSNLVSDSGFPLPNSAVIINYNPANLIYDEHYIKANLTMAQAKALYKSFLAQPKSKYLDSSIMPKDLPLIPGNKQWNPLSVKKYWSGSFAIGKGQDAYYCQYSFDAKYASSVILYFHGVSSNQ